MKQKRFSDALGLRLTRQALRVLKERGIFAHSPVSLEHQHLAKRYVVRGLESGGAAGELGRYVTFTQEDGQPVEWLHPVEAIGVNGLHAVVVAPVLVRVEMLRKGQHLRTADYAASTGCDQRWKAAATGNKTPVSGHSRSLGSGFVRKGQGQSWHGSADVLFARRGGSQDTEAVSPSGARDNRGGSLRRLFPLPLCQAAAEERGTGVRRGKCHSLTWLNGRSE